MLVLIKGTLVISFDLKNMSKTWADLNKKTFENIRSLTLTFPFLSNRI